tara:strand:+ start:69 stop:428 length:360 start_codon:yes stop_codon:yes gene_type:complete
METHPSPRQLAQEYMRIFFESHDFDRLLEICAPDLQFDGPFFEGNTAREYVDSLRHGPPVDCGYDLLFEFYDATHAHLVYDFIKGQIRTPMSQTFEVDDGLIQKIKLIFDTEPFGHSAS